MCAILSMLAIVAISYRGPDLQPQLFFTRLKEEIETTNSIIKVEGTSR